MADERQQIESPDCRDQVAATVRVLHGLSQISAEAFPIDEAQLLALASTVVVTDRDTRSVDQIVQSNHANQRVPFKAITGSLALADVPMALLPWLYSGGKLHVGDRRGAAAGGWSLTPE